MSDLTLAEKRKFERLFDMGGGYVLNFSNARLDDFVIDSTGLSIYDKKYGSGSKANQLRSFWREEKNEFVAKLLTDLLDYMEQETFAFDKDLFIDCRRIVGRLRGNAVAEVNAIAQMADEPDMEVVAKAVLDAIEKNELVAGLDRLHTFTIKYFRSLCEGLGLSVGRNKPLHSLYGEYVRALREDGHLESNMTVSILKSLHGPLDAFSFVRNEQSLAHDNTLLNHEEALLIFNHVTSALRFLRDLEQRVQRREEDAAKKSQDTERDDEIPF